MARLLKNIPLLSCFAPAFHAEGQGDLSLSRARELVKSLGECYPELDCWSTSQEFKYDLIELCAKTIPRCGDLSVLELGANNGATTAVLGTLFRTVVGLETNNNLLRTARQTLSTHGVNNAVLLAFDIYRDNWATFGNNAFPVIFIDARHEEPYIYHDTLKALSAPNATWLIFHDYGSHSGAAVKKTVDKFVDSGHLLCKWPLGLHPSSPGLKYPGLAAGGASEGIACKVRKRWQPTLLKEMLSGWATTYLLYATRATDYRILRLPLERCEFGSAAAFSRFEDHKPSRVAFDVVCHKPSFLGDLWEGGDGEVRYGRATLIPMQLSESGPENFADTIELQFWNFNAPWLLQFDAHMSGSIIIANPGSPAPGGLEQGKELTSSMLMSADLRRVSTFQESTYMFIREDSVMAQVSRSGALLDAYETAGINCGQRPKPLSCELSM
eukprot:TRINITY_DN102303_c0_g1_i1.p1 TRINITY_DN102303_c0_g1~~TRINITY_DN102303_c0_g1_i1.p1  ORF type:complete len:441 (-),score=49.57 TRINITY_DN102303_c0_g1_i1:490-1812(-)